MEKLMEGVVLLVAGMGIVYAFLLLMVCVMSLSAKIIPRFNHILPDEAPKKKAAPAAPGGAGDDAAVALAIAVARSRA